MTVRSRPTSKHVPRKERRYHVKRWQSKNARSGPCDGCCKTYPYCWSQCYVIQPVWGITLCKEWLHQGWTGPLSFWNTVSYSVQHTTVSSSMTISPMGRKSTLVTSLASQMNMAITVDKDVTALNFLLAGESVYVLWNQSLSLVWQDTPKFHDQSQSSPVIPNWFICIKSHAKSTNPYAPFWLMTNLMQSFSMCLFHASTYFKQQVLIIRRTKLY